MQEQLIWRQQQRLFKEEAEENGGKSPHIAHGVEFYIAAKSQPEQVAAEEAGDWQGS